MKKCSYCGQMSADEAVQCPICATPLGDERAAVTAEAPAAAEPVPSSVRIATERQMRRGAFWCVGGILVTGITYANAAHSPTGGSYCVAWGAIIFGALQFFRGWSHRGDQPAGPAVAEGREAGEMARQELARATALETEGKIPEALAAYGQVAENYPHLEAGHDAAVSLKSLRERLG